MSVEDGRNKSVSNDSVNNILLIMKLILHKTF